MGKINDARKGLLETQVQFAVVESVGTPAGEPGLDENYYSVFVPGAVREFNTVSADSEEEAVAKVKSLLISKIDQMAEVATENVEIQPDNMDLKMKKTVRPATEEEING